MLHERSRFVRRGDRWVYLDGDTPERERTPLKGSRDRPLSLSKGLGEVGVLADANPFEALRQLRERSGQTAATEPRHDVQGVALGVEVEGDRVALDHLAGQHAPGQLVLDRRLDQPAERTGAVRRVEARERQPVPGGLRRLDA